MYSTKAIATPIETPPMELILLTKNYANPGQLVAVWQRDKNSNLYCQWVQQTNTINK